MSRRPATQAHTLATNATIIAALITPTINNLNLSTGGYPATTPGAPPATPTGSLECGAPDCTNERPCNLHGDDVTLTTTERQATQHDQALTDLQALRDHLRQADHHANRAAQICTQWGHPGLTDTDIKTRLRTIDTQIWCEHCSRFGRHEPRAKDRLWCNPCIDFQTRYKRPPDPAQYEAYDARGARWETQTVHRIIRRTDNERKARQAAERTAQRNAKKASA